MGRAPCCSKEGLNRGAWTALEDKILVDYISAHGEGKWRKIPKLSGLKRCGKSCRLRWLNYLRPDIKRGNVSPEEEDLIIRLHKLLGNRWSLIAGRLPGRTDNEIKNYWNTTLRKKMKSDETNDGARSTKKLAKAPAKSNVVGSKAVRLTESGPTLSNPQKVLTEPSRCHDPAYDSPVTEDSKSGHASPIVTSSEEEIDELPNLTMDFSVTDLLASDISGPELWKLLDGAIEQPPLLYSEELLKNWPADDGYYQFQA